MCRCPKSNTSYCTLWIPSLIFLGRASPHLPALSFVSCFHTQAFLHHPTGMVIFMYPDLHVPSVGQNHSEHTYEALTSVPETPQWFSAELCGLLGHLWFAAAESPSLGCFPQLISSWASLCTLGYLFSDRNHLRGSFHSAWGAENPFYSIRINSVGNPKETPI